MDDKEHNGVLGFPYWRRISEIRYERVDGAVVKWDDDGFYSNPLNPNSLMWTAWEPDPGQSFVPQYAKNRKLRWPKRWKTYEKAIKACDEYFPLIIEQIMES